MPAVRILCNSANMTRLTVADGPVQEFSVRGSSAISESDDEGFIFYDDVTKVQVLPDEQCFTMRIITPHIEVEMDFPDADSVREALALFESKKISEVNAQSSGSIRITLVESGPIGSDSKGPFIKSPEKMPEQVPSRPDLRPVENLPHTQKR